MESHQELFIGGEWVAPEGDETIDVVSPQTEETIATVAAASPADVDRAVQVARTAFDDGPWPRLTPAERIAAVRRFAAVYAEHRKELVETIVSELGAPVRFAKTAQVWMPTNNIGVLADIAESYAWEETRPGVFGRDVLMRREPVGVVAAVVPWNMPQFLIVTKVVPALLAGCTVVVKPAPEAALDALLLARIVEASGFPPGVVNIIPGGRETGAHLVGHPGVDKVSFTGSSDAGRLVAQACAANLTKVSLELGGKSAAIALDDADPATVAAAVSLSAMGMAGQICNGLTRVLAPAERADEYAEALAAELAGLHVGDPADPATDVGPIISRRQQERVLGYIEAGEREGARLVLGGTGLPDGIERGWYVRPTVFADVDSSMSIAREEIFGPVFVVIPHSGDDHAVALANDSDYGLSGSVVTADTGRGLQIAARVRSGSFGVNEGYSNDPVAPFGGVKGSGYGRELGREGLDAYVDVKSITVAP